MSKQGWLVIALVAAGAGYTLKGGCLNTSVRAPDTKLADSLGDLCKIARANIESPSKGVSKLGEYMGKHVGEMYGAWGDTLAEIEKITDDDKHDARARQARDRIRKPVLTCAQTWNKFLEAVVEDPEASEKVENFNERLNRTHEIILGDGQHLDIRTLPALFAGKI